MNYGIHDFSRAQWSHLLDAMRKINPDAPLHATQGLCGNIATAVQLLETTFGERDKPEVYLMLEALFLRMGLDPNKPVGVEDVADERPWEGENKRRRVLLLERMLVEVTGIVHAPQPAIPAVAYLGVAA